MLLKRVRFVRHVSADACLRAFWREPCRLAGVTIDDAVASEEYQRDLEIIKANGWWGHAHPKTRTVNYWAKRSISKTTLLRLLAHEVGHLVGLKANWESAVRMRGASKRDRRDWAEELRADLYGAVALVAYEEALRA